MDVNILLLSIYVINLSPGFLLLLRDSYGIGRSLHWLLHFFLFVSPLGQFNSTCWWRSVLRDLGFRCLSRWLGSGDGWSQHGHAVLVSVFRMEEDWTAFIKEVIPRFLPVDSLNFLLLTVLRSLLVNVLEYLVGCWSRFRYREFYFTRLLSSWGRRISEVLVSQLLMQD
jgi:hypothetical protein